MSELKDWLSKNLDVNEKEESIKEMDFEQANNAAIVENLSNLKRKELGLDIDEDLEPVICDRCGKETNKLKLIPMDRGKGLEMIYHCENCI